MTTTLPAMEHTIELLRAQAPHVTIMVGGAVLTEDYAQRIGADHYPAGPRLAMKREIRPEQISHSRVGVSPPTCPCARFPEALSSQEV